jgi:hypothetical protein
VSAAATEGGAGPAAPEEDEGAGYSGAAAIRALAREFHLPDVEALRLELVNADRFAVVGIWGVPLDGSRGIPSHRRELLADPRYRRLMRLSRLHQALTIELSPGEGDDPLLRSKEAAQLRKALARFGARLGRAELTPALPGANGRTFGTRFVAELARAWPRLTGETPTAWRDGSDAHKPGGRFYRFACAACALYGFPRPSVDAVRDAIP